jgi:tRNA threonylcarbamoyladenosine biosynthesis protein TsaE
LDLVVKNLSETQELGRKLAYCCSSLQDSCVIYLIGDLGVGKTTLAQSFIQYFGFDRVKSPTYSLVESYQNEDINIHHFDCYRLCDPEELEYIGIREYLMPKHLQLIEWPELGKGVIAKADISINLSGDGDERKINIESLTKVGKIVTRCAIA